MPSTSVSVKTVVVADDTAFVRDRFQAALEHAGHKAIPIKSAAELLSGIRTNLSNIDLVVLDLRLSNTPGVELVRNIRRLDNGRLTILIFSGTISSADEVRDLAGLGIAHHASWLFTDVLASGEVVRILDQHAPPPFPINAVTAAGRRMPSRVRHFIDFLAAICAEEPELRVVEGSSVRERTV